MTRVRHMGFWLVLSGIVLAAPAIAADNTCKLPVSPIVPDGRTAESHQLVVAANDVKKFIADSDQYQQCLNDWVAGEQLAATEAKKPLDPKIKADHDRLGDANQKEKERVGGLYNTAAAAYLKAHPSRRR